MAQARRFRTVGVGDTLGRYRLGDELGEGGMAAVYAAFDTELRRDVAIKILFPHLCKRADVVSRFQREARAMAALDHPHVLRIFDVGGAATGGDDGALDPPHMVMELVTGGDLQGFLAANGPPPAEVVALMGCALCDALGAAHAAGMVHRDVKPSNVLIGEDGRLVLTDFGVARIAEGDSLVTRTGAVIGTPAFMSPEQARGAAVDVRSDLYSLGALLYQTATGQLPFKGSPMVILTDIAAGNVVPPLERNPRMGRELAECISHLMGTLPELRPASAADARSSLAAVAAAAGLHDADAQLARYFRSPGDFNAEWAPRILASVLDRAEQCSGRGDMPTALALLDRAMALDDGNPRAATLLDNLGAQRQRGRQRWVIAGAALAVALGTAVGLAWPGTGDARQDGADSAAARAMGGPEPRGAGGAAKAEAGTEPETEAAPEPEPEAEPEPDEAEPETGTEIAARTETVDGAAGAAEANAASGGASSAARPGRKAGGRRAQAGQGGRRRAAASKPAATGARPPASEDEPAAAVKPEAAESAQDTPAAAAPPAATAPPAPPPADAVVTLEFDTWCRLAVDGTPRSQYPRTKTLTLRPGPHQLTCTQGPGAPGVALDLDLRAGERRTVRGELLAPVSVRVSVAGDAVIIDGKRVENGASVRLAPRRWRVQRIRDGKVTGQTWVRVPAGSPCTLTDSPRWVCRGR